MITVVAPALRALLDELFDYAGLFPPAQLTLNDVIGNYEAYRDGDYTWMLRWLVVRPADLDQISSKLDGTLSILTDSDNARAATLETTAVVSAQRPVYCEVPLDKLDMLDAVKNSNNFAKIRTGGLKPEAIPTPQDVAKFINACSERRLAFKATAGLHHPIRAENALTYEPDAPRAFMHGFLNVLMASAFAWHGERDIEPVIAETDASAFSFDDHAHWRNLSLTTEEVKQARINFMHAIGSCSFDEPVHDLKALSLL